MGLEAFVTVFLAASGALTFVQVLSVLGGLSGLAAVIGAIASWRYNSRKTKQEDKSVAITELEKALPGLGTIVEHWEQFGEKMREENTALQTENAALRVRIAELEARLSVNGRAATN